MARVNTADTRYQKLNSMIVKGKERIQSLMGEIVSEHKMRQDLLVKPNNIKIAVLGGAKNPGPLQIVPTICGETMKFTDHSHGQYLGRVGVAERFAQKLIELEEAPLLETILNRLMAKQMSEGALVRRVGPQIKGWLSPSYKRMDTAPVIEQFVKSVSKMGLSPFGGRNTDYRTQIQFVLPEVMQVGNDFISFGLSLVTGDYGSQALELNLLMIRISCLNLHEGYDMFRKIHLGSRFDMGDDDVIKLSRQTVELDSKTVASAIGDATASFGDHIKLLQAKVKKATEKEIKDPEPLYKMIRDKGVRKEIVDQVKSVYESQIGIEVLPQENNLWRLTNALSYVSQGVKKKDEQIDLERVAMSLLN